MKDIRKRQRTLIAFIVFIAALLIAAVLWVYRQRVKNIEKNLALPATALQRLPLLVGTIAFSQKSFSF